MQFLSTAFKAKIIIMSNPNNASVTSDLQLSRNPWWGLWVLRFCAVTHSHPGNLSEAHGDWMSAPSYPLSSRNPRWGLWGGLRVHSQLSIHTREPLVRPLGNRSPYSVTCRHPGTLGEASKDSESSQWPAHDLPTYRNHLWGQQELGVHGQWPQVI